MNKRQDTENLIADFELSDKHRGLEKERDKARSNLEFMRDLFQIQGQRLNDVLRERDRLAAALREIDMARLDDFMGPHDMALKCVLIARESLAAVEGGEP
jgi:hypothetical protein